MTTLAGRTKQNGNGHVRMMPVDDLRPSPENERLYRPINPDDDDLAALAESIREHGIREPITITSDGWIVSGHRRHAAAILVGLDVVPVWMEDFTRDSDPDRFLKLLREHNRQRVKSRAELLREAVIDIEVDEDEAVEALERHRRQESDKTDFSDLAIVAPRESKYRARISKAKQPMLDAVKRIIAERGKYWPLSDRQIHYALLNAPPLLHASKPGSAYQNDRSSYQSLCDLLTRARLTGEVSWDAIGDATRPVTIFDVHAGPQPFLKREMDGFLGSYWRDLQQSQPNHIEIVAEKLTVQGILKPLASEFCIPMTIGRGYCSLAPRREMAQRFRQSGKDRLVILMLSDHDPDGQTIAESFARSLQDDFNIGVTAVRVALTADQAEELGLPALMTAKTSSSNYARFTEEQGDDVVHELEAVEPETLQEMLRDAIVAVMDLDALEHERLEERKDAVFLERVRRQVNEFLAQVDLGSGDEEG